MSAIAPHSTTRFHAADGGRSALKACSALRAGSPAFCRKRVRTSYIAPLQRAALTHRMSQNLVTCREVQARAALTAGERA